MTHQTPRAPHRTPALCAFSRQSRRNNGATLLESIAYLGIAAFVILGAVSLFNKALRDSQTNQLIKDIAQVLTAVRKHYQGESSYAGLSLAVINDARAIPSGWVCNFTAIPVCNTGPGAQVLLIQASVMAANDVRGIGVVIGLRSNDSGTCATLTKALLDMGALGVHSRGIDGAADMSTGGMSEIDVWGGFAVMPTSFIKPGATMQQILDGSTSNGYGCATYRSANSSRMQAVFPG